MRLSLIMESKNKKIPIGYRMMLVSLFKNAIEKGDKDLFNEMYFYKDKKNKKIKPFSFAVYLNDFKIDSSYINVNGDISITISTSDYNLGIALYNGLLRIKEFAFKNDYILINKKISLVKEKQINNSNMCFKTLSPIYLKDENNKPVGIEGGGFERQLNYISNVFLESYRGYGLKEKLEFSNINMKKQVVKEEVKDFTEHSNKKYMFINAYSGLFKLEGNSEDLQLLYENGVGFRRSEGFGLIDLV